MTTNTGFGMRRHCVLWLLFAIWEVAPQVTERVGCFQDGSPFILTGMIYRRRSDMTVDWCLNECLIRRGDVFAGLGVGYACLCGNNMDHTRYGSQRPDSECWQSPCPGNRSQTCGGLARLEIYRSMRENNSVSIATALSNGANWRLNHIYMDYNECWQHNGGCVMACINTPLPYYCDCHNAPETAECSCRDGFDPVDGGKMLQCTDRNECDVDNGGCNQKCVNSLGAYHCACHMGYRLVGGEKQNCTDVNECTDDPDLCNMDNFECINTPVLYQCECKPGYFNDQGSCSDIDECSLRDDKCNQNCSNTDGDYICSCMAGYELAGDELYNCTDVQDCILLEQIAGLEGRINGFIVGLAVTSLAFATCLVILLRVCLRQKRDKCISTPPKDIPAVAPCYEDVTNYDPPEGSAHYEGLQEFHLEDSTYQTVTPSVQTS